jgi:hypothetical protein
MVQIEIIPTGEHRFRVTIRDGQATTDHDVKVPPPLVASVGMEPADEERLVKMSFEFLLEREPAASILPRFDLDVIGHYFPEYVATLQDRAGSPGT